MAEEKEVLLEVKDLNVTYGSGRKAFAAVQLSLIHISEPTRP